MSRTSPAVMQNLTDDQYKSFAKALLDLHDHSGDLRWKRYQKFVMGFGLAILIASAIMMYLSYGTTHEYLPRIRGVRASSASPFEYALSSAVLALVFLWRPRKLWLAAFMSMLALGQSVLSWLARI